MEKKYVVKKRIDLFEFIRCHKEERGWENMIDACQDFQNDVGHWIRNCYPTWTLKTGDVWPGSMFHGGKISKQFIPNLIKYGFIEEMKSEVFYKRGDIFQLMDEGMFSKNYYLLTGTERGMFLASISPPTSSFWNCPVRVENSSKVTEEEMGRIFGTGNFRLVKGEIVVKEGTR